MKKDTVLIIAVVLLLLGLITTCAFGLYFFFRYQTVKNKEDVDNVENELVDDEESETEDLIEEDEETVESKEKITGVLRKSSVYYETAEASTKYLLIPNEDPSQSFYVEFKVNVLPKTVKPLLGDCVVLSGDYAQEPLDPVPSESYDFPVFEADDIEKVAYSKCNPYENPQNLSQYDDSAVTFKGDLLVMERPDPYINYDYKIILNPPAKSGTELFEDLMGGAGDNGLPISQITVIPASDAVWIDFQKNIGKSVRVNGYALWGLAESKYVLVTGIKEVL